VCVWSALCAVRCALSGTPGTLRGGGGGARTFPWHDDCCWVRARRRRRPMATGRKKASRRRRGRGTNRWAVVSTESQESHSEIHTTVCVCVCVCVVRSAQCVWWPHLARRQWRRRMGPGPAAAAFGAPRERAMNVECVVVIPVVMMVAVVVQLRAHDDDDTTAHRDDDDDGARLSTIHAWHTAAAATRSNGLTTTTTTTTLSSRFVSTTHKPAWLYRSGSLFGDIMGVWCVCGRRVGRCSGGSPPPRGPHPGVLVGMFCPLAGHHHRRRMPPPLHRSRVRACQIQPVGGS
jgi:hypothetical protein